MKNSLKHVSSWISTKDVNDVIDVLNEWDIPEKTAIYLQAKLQEIQDNIADAVEEAWGEDI